MNFTSEYMEQLLLEFQGLLGNWSILCKPIIILAILLLAWLSDIVCRKGFKPLVRKIVRKTNFSWDDMLFNDRVLDNLCHIVPALVVYTLLPMAFFDKPLVLLALTKLGEVYLLVMILKLLLCFLRSLYLITENRSKDSNRPLKGIYQMVQVLVVCIGVILVFSILFGKSPIDLLVGLGAAATVLMLIFKDTIVGLVSGVQLAANDMLRKGDWIALPKHGVDGRVEEVNLTTVKVRNWDKTIYTIPPYTLVSESFQNWRGMEQDSAGRRVKRHVRLDMSTVRFCTKEEKARYLSEGLLTNEEAAGEISNSTVFRRHLMQHLTQRKDVNSDMTIMVRQLQPTEHGLPLELYFFTADKDWGKHETVQADIFDYVISSVPRFGLRVFQSPSGEDLRKLS